jgi:CBS domain containing-hemolysin-like protein
MTPRSKVVWVEVKSDRNTILNMVESHRFSRLLVCDATVDRLVGFVHTKHLLPEALGCKDISLATLMTPLLCVPDSTSVPRFLNQFKKRCISPWWSINMVRPKGW